MYFKTVVTSFVFLISRLDCLHLVLKYFTNLFSRLYINHKGYLYVHPFAMSYLEIMKVNSSCFKVVTDPLVARLHLQWAGLGFECLARHRLDILYDSYIAP